MTNTNLNLNNVLEEKHLNEEKQYLFLVRFPGKKGDFFIKYRKRCYRLRLGQK